MLVAWGRCDSWRVECMHACMTPFVVLGSAAASAQRLSLQPLYTVGNLSDTWATCSATCSAPVQRKPSTCTCSRAPSARVLGLEVYQAASLCVLMLLACKILLLACNSVLLISCGLQSTCAASGRRASTSCRMGLCCYLPHPSSGPFTARCVISPDGS